MKRLREFVQWQEGAHDRMYRGWVCWGIEARRKYAAWIRVPCAVVVMAAFFGLCGVEITSSVGTGGWFALIGPMLIATGMAGSRYGRMNRISKEEADRARASSADKPAPGGIHRGL